MSFSRSKESSRRFWRIKKCDRGICFLCLCGCPIFRVLCERRVFVAQVVPPPAAKVYLQDELSPLHKVSGRPDVFPAEFVAHGALRLPQRPRGLVPFVFLLRVPHPFRRVGPAFAFFRSAALP